MSASIRFNGLNSASVRRVVTKLSKTRTSYDAKMQTVCERLATLGAVRASLEFSRAPYSGENDVAVTAEPYGSGWRVRASGEAVLFIEFGAGVTYGYGHPDPQGYGPGTYPSTKGHWDDPNGWWYAHGRHTYGNPPAAAMYHAEQDIRASIERVVSEVFGQE